MTPIESATAAVMEAMADGPGSRDYLRAQAIARAAIAAIREPSEGMVTAGNGSKPYNLVGLCEGTIHPVVQRAWPAMIDALLAEEGPA